MYECCLSIYSLLCHCLGEIFPTDIAVFCLEWNEISFSLKRFHFWNQWSVASVQNNPYTQDEGKNRDDFKFSLFDEQYYSDSIGFHANEELTSCVPWDYLEFLTSYERFCSIRSGFHRLTFQWEEFHDFIICGHDFHCSGDSFDIFSYPMLLPEGFEFDIMTKWFHVINWNDCPVYSCWYVCSPEQESHVFLGPHLPNQDLEFEVDDPFAKTGFLDSRPLPPPFIHLGTMVDFLRKWMEGEISLWGDKLHLSKGARSPIPPHCAQ
jgi:hypothetical protein